MISKTVELHDLLSDDAIESAADKIRQAQHVWYPGAARFFPDETTEWHRAMARAALDGALRAAVPTQCATGHPIAIEDWQKAKALLPCGCPDSAATVKEATA